MIGLITRDKLRNCSGQIGVSRLSLFEALTLATAELRTILSAEYLALTVRNMRQIECTILLLEEWLSLGEPR